MNAPTTSGLIDAWGRFGWLRRRWWVPVVSTLAVGLLWASLATTVTSQYTAEAVLVVPSGAGQDTPGSAGEANKLAYTYALLVPEDRGTRERLATTLALTPQEAADALSAFNDEDTSLLRVQVQHSSADGAVAGARAVAQALAGREPVSPAIPPGSLVLASLPDEAHPAASTAVASGGTGVLLGLILGLILMLAWERADARVDTLETASVEIGAPASAVHDLTVGSVAALLDRWRMLGAGSPTRIALLPVVPRTDLRELAQRLATAGRASHRSVSWEVAPRHLPQLDALDPQLLDGAHRDDTPADVVLVVDGAPGSDEAGELTALASDLTVLVVPMGTRSTDLRAGANMLARFGVKPAWGVLVRRNPISGRIRVPDRLPAQDVADAPLVGANARRPA